MKTFKFILMATAMCIITACQAHDPGEPGGQPNSEQLLTGFIEVELKIDQNVETEAAVNIQAIITEEEKPVDTAQVGKVTFEFWKAGDRQQSWEEQGTLAEAGVYTADTSFNEEGVYYVQSHVTARGTHAMPKEQVIAGNVSEDAVLAAEEAEKNSDVSDMDSMTDMEGHDSGGGGHHH
ncbi:FixH family protein [Aureibacillus halotolerans]|uniref:YtkA-like protein n=1 Tax=Aureibacillus halotolerans TaxID=1508390 RepID=A0A4R6TU57_9BACI|nr:FixH family protein [Aureibacillus halotolerans]TDQ34618.1 YtkA-like protein [Aureibacillus halotolerans]